MLRVLVGIVSAVAVLVGAVLGGVTVTMRDSYSAGGGSGPFSGGWPVPRSAPAGATVVAVLLGTDGTVVSDALLPYEAFARDSHFFVYTVAAERRPTPLSGGLGVVPEHTFDTAPSPDVVVVPAVVRQEPQLRDWLRGQASRGAYLLGVCAGAEVLADAGLLAGRRATSFWQRLGGLRDSHPDTTWLAGERFVEDGRIITTAGVTSGLAGSLRLIELLAGPDVATRVGREVSYHDWAPRTLTHIPERSLVVGDLPYALNAAFPRLRPTIGIGLTDGVGEIDLAAAFETYAGTSFAARTVPVATQPTVTTRHGLLLTADLMPVDRLIVPGVDRPGSGTAIWAADRHIDITLPHAGRKPGEFAFDPLLRDLAEHTDRATARTTAKFTEYPVDHLMLTGAAWPWRSTVIAVLVLGAAVGAGVLPTWVARRRRRRMHSPVLGLGPATTHASADARSPSLPG
ncbi:transcriptional regulator [Actinoplanes philippinensis]|uniref:Transcriptional regulator GlxA family, contains an amidase domain and an AraC-type DNA-binding HTH domain n=1 Tax=Actinoplanes philippinensis TaxID=35752 RepID=A0A1I2MR34_9ACTN|nr:DJ-1/PfpI family protein [Actinoplanes philippinensis]GIE83235.1 transcriptional regulator [Actinoplanes philippinensis]SFF94035.1 Transcriptional regulator GlxA family, contains an amidase domain and an AraC-type DNA-binding HTH domain [Actinoplanes philippinensis]